MKLSDLKKKTRELDVQFRDEQLHITYRLNVVTPLAVESWRNKPTDETILTQTALVVERWDLTDDAGQELPVSVETLRDLPLVFSSTIIQAIINDLNAPRTDTDQKKG